MTNEELLQQARARGATFHVLESSRLKVQAPSPLPADRMAELRLHKTTILSLLAGDVTPNWPGGAARKDTDSLLAWAAEAAETDLTLPEPVQFQETPLRPYTTAEVGIYCRQQLKYLSLARPNQATDGSGRFTREWWTEMKVNSIEALAALKAAIDAAETPGENREVI